MTHIQFLIEVMFGSDITKYKTDNLFFYIFEISFCMNVNKGLPTKDETSETIVRNLLSLFS